MINWEEIDSLHARAIVHTGKIKVSAVLAFNSAGQLVNFFRMTGMRPMITSSILFLRR